MERPGPGLWSDAILKTMVGLVFFLSSPNVVCLIHLRLRGSNKRFEAWILFDGACMAFNGFFTRFPQFFYF